MSAPAEYLAATSAARDAWWATTHHVAVPDYIAQHDEAIRYIRVRADVDEATLKAACLSCRDPLLAATGATEWANAMLRHDYPGVRTRLLRFQRVAKRVKLAILFSPAAEIRG